MEKEVAEMKKLYNYACADELFFARGMTGIISVLIY